jgi:hypothetical protein
MPSPQLNDRPANHDDTARSTKRVTKISPCNRHRIPASLASFRIRRPRPICKMPPFAAVERSALPERLGDGPRHACLSGLIDSTRKAPAAAALADDWTARFESCRSASAEALERGPGTVLSRMASALFPDGRARAAEEFRTAASVRLRTCKRPRDWHGWLSRSQTRRRCQAHRGDREHEYCAATDDHLY